MNRVIWVVFVLLGASPALASDAAQFYAAACATCHGVAGAGDGPVAAGLPIKVAAFTDPAFWAERTDAVVEKAIREGGPAIGKSPLMGAFGASLSKDEMSALLVYLKAFVKPSGPETPPPAKPQASGVERGATEPAGTPDDDPDTTASSGLSANLRPEPNLDAGAALYRTRCAVCHGRRGNGAGPAARGMDPRPRDLVEGVYKLTSTPMGEPAAQADPYRAVTHGMRGTAMPGWNGLPSDDRWQLVYYMESLSPRFADGAGQPFEIPDPPPATAALVAQGEQVYDASGCAACHGADGRGGGVGGAKLVDSNGRRVWPADMTRGWRFKGGSGSVDIYRTLTAGIEGTPMPSYAHLSSEQRWGLVHWIRAQFADADVTLQ